MHVLGRTRRTPIPGRQRRRPQRRPHHSLLGARASSVARTLGTLGTGPSQRDWSTFPPTRTAKPVAKPQ